VEQAREKYEVSERHACRLLGQWRRTQRYAAIPRIDEEELTEAIIALASEYGRYGYRRITALLQRDGWQVAKDRVQRIWRREGLKVPQRQRPRGRLWLNDGSCFRLRPESANHVWSYDFVSAMTHDGRTLRMLTLIDEYTRECLAIRVARRLGRYEVIEALADVMLYREFRKTSARTTARSSWPRSCASGWRRWERGRCTSNREALGRMATAKASTGNCGMNV
jgi:putative transposase